MGRQRRPKPKYLAKKLKKIREELGIGQMEMAKRLSAITRPLDGAIVSRFERGEREPNLLVIVAYCDVAQITASVLIDDRWSVKDLVWAMKKK
jgi:transcriptional regulator with XRE-family HTH domain